MLHIAVVEDDPRSAQRLAAYFERLGAALGESFSLAQFGSAEQLLEPYPAGLDLVLMDIDLPGMDGMEAAHRLRQMDSRVVLLFVTNMAQYAVKGYEVEALDFLVKPVAYADFAFKLRRALQAVQFNARRELTVPLAGGFRRLSTDKLMYVEVSGHCVRYHLPGEVVESRGKLAKVEQQLAACPFLRCNNCYLVNPRYVEWVQGYTVKVGGDELQISHPRRKAFMQALSQWLARGGL